MSADLQTNSPNKKSWITFAVMFLVGLGGGALAFHLATRMTNDVRPVASAALETNPATAVRDADSHSSTTTEEIRLLREEVALLRATGKTNPENQSRVEVERPTSSPAKQTSAASTGQRTLAYWNKLNGIMSREAAMRSAPPQLTAANAMSFVSSQASAYEFAAGAIRQLSTSGVDPQAANIGREIAAWYDQGIANSKGAESLLGSDDVAARQGAAGQGWSATEKQHREQCLAINRRGAQLRQELTRKYGIEFPPLQ
jgi:hypothetical protein